jgi:hypothetical protein
LASALLIELSRNDDRSAEKLKRPLGAFPKRGAPIARRKRETEEVSETLIRTDHRPIRKAGVGCPSRQPSYETFLIGHFEFASFSKWSPRAAREAKQVRLINSRASGFTGVRRQKYSKFDPIVNPLTDFLSHNRLGNWAI